MSYFVTEIFLIAPYLCIGAKVEKIIYFVKWMIFLCIFGRILFLNLVLEFNSKQFLRMIQNVDCMDVKFFKVFWYLITLLALSSCGGSGAESRQDDSTSNTSDIKVALHGVVTNPEGYPVPFVTVTTKDGEMETDSLGGFVLENPKIEGNRYVVKFSKEGFYDFFYSKEAFDSSEVSIVISPRGNTDISRSISFPSKKGVELNVNGMMVQIPTNAIAYDDSGEEYNGIVKMDVLYLNPDSANFKRMMPGGDMLALRTSLDTTFLISCGMVNVLLSDEEGRKLQLKDSTQASLTYPIPVAMQKCAPDTMPLWFFDEQKGLWIEEGFAVKSGNVYKGVVKHFTWWNGDFPNLCARLNLKVMTKSGCPYSYGCVNLKFHYQAQEEEDLKSKVWFLPEFETAELDRNGCSRGYVPAGVTIDFIALGETIGHLKPLERGQEVDLSLICDNLASVFLKFEDAVGNPLPYFSFHIRQSSDLQTACLSDREGLYPLVSKLSGKVDLYYQSEKIASFSPKKWMEEKTDTQVVVFDFINVDYAITGDIKKYATVFFYDGKKSYLSFLGQKVFLPNGRKYDVVVSGFKIGEIPKNTKKGQKFVFNFNPLTVINTRSSEPVDYYIYLVGKTKDGIRPEQIAADDGYQIAASPIISYMKEFNLIVHCNDMSFAIKNKRKNGYFEPMVVDLAKAGAVANEVDLYRKDSLLLAYRLAQPLYSYVEKDTAYYYFKEAVLKLPNFMNEKKTEYKAVFFIKDVCAATELPVKMKILKEGRMEYAIKSKVMYLKDSSMVDVETKLQLPAVALGSLKKNNQLTVDPFFPELAFPLDFVCQHSYEIWSNLYACNKVASHSEVERMRKFLEKKGYDESVVKRVLSDDYEEYWYSLLREDGNVYQVNIRYSKEAKLDPSEQKVKFIFTIPGSASFTSTGDLESTSMIENCPLKGCQLFVAYSKMNVIGSKEFFKAVKEKEQKEAELAKKNAKKKKKK